MSSINTERMTARKMAFGRNKPFCAFCYDLGKTESVYTSHFVRATPQLNSTIVCPELNACVCMGCGCKGHTIRNCDKNTTPTNKVVVCEIKKSIPVCNPKSYNIYSAFSDSEDDDEEDTTTISSTLSDLSENSAEPIKSYASVVTTVRNVDEMRTKLLAILQPKKHQSYDFTVFRATKRYASWADAESSDDEE
jgi:hypothetical protein